MVIWEPACRAPGVFMLFQAISEFDVVGMERAGEKISKAREQLDPKLDAYVTARDACRANAKG